MQPSTIIRRKKFFTDPSWVQTHDLLSYLSCLAKVLHSMMRISPPWLVATNLWRPLNPQYDPWSGHRCEKSNRAGVKAALRTARCYQDYQPIWFNLKKLCDNFNKQTLLWIVSHFLKLADFFGEKKYPIAIIPISMMNVVPTLPVTSTSPFVNIKSSDPGSGIIKQLLSVRWTIGRYKFSVF